MCTFSFFTEFQSRCERPCWELPCTVPRWVCADTGICSCQRLSWWVVIDHTSQDSDFTEHICLECTEVQCYCSIEIKRCFFLTSLHLPQGAFWKSSCSWSWLSSLNNWRKQYQFSFLITRSHLCTARSVKRVTQHATFHATPLLVY